MESIAKALLTAKEEVFITDWWLSPEIMLVRPADDERFRLDNLLGEIAVREKVICPIERIFSLGQRRSCLRVGLQRGGLCHGFKQFAHETCVDRQE